MKELRAIAIVFGVALIIGLALLVAGDQRTACQKWSADVWIPARDASYSSDADAVNAMSAAMDQKPDNCRPDGTTY
jgi:hypothetical protein